MHTRTDALIILDWLDFSFMIVFCCKSRAGTSVIKNVEEREVELSDAKTHACTPDRFKVWIPLRSAGRSIPPGIDDVVPDMFGNSNALICPLQVVAYTNYGIQTAYRISGRSRMRGVSHYRANF